MGISWGSPVVSCTVVLLGAMTVMDGCASAMNDKELGEPCTRTEQCLSGLVCSGGLCTEHTRRTPRKDAEAPVDEDAGESRTSQSEIEEAP